MTNEPIALISGANRGLGLEVARQLAARGYFVIIGSRELEDGTDAARSIGERAIAARLDVTDRATIDALASMARERFARLDVLVNNAAVYGDQRAGIAEIAIDAVEATVRTNTYGPLLMTQAFVPLLRKSAHGRIVNVSSAVGQLDKMTDFTPAYALSKAALNALTRLFADSLKKDRILVNSVCPGWVRTRMGGPGAPRTIEQGADTIVWLATLADDGPTGGFFRDRQPIEW